MFKARPRDTSSWRNSKYLIYFEVTDNFCVSGYPRLENCLFGAVKLTKNAENDKYRFSGYRIGFDRHGGFSFSNGVGKNLLIFRVDMSSSTIIDNRKNYIFILRKVPTQDLEHKLCAEKLYLINFTV